MVYWKLSSPVPVHHGVLEAVIAGEGSNGNVVYGGVTHESGFGRRPELLAFRAQLSRVGGSRWGWVLRMKFRAIALNHCSLLIAPSRPPRSLPLRPLMKGFRSLTEPTLVALATPDGVGFSK